MTSLPFACLKMMLFWVRMEQLQQNVSIAPINLKFHSKDKYFKIYQIYLQDKINKSTLLSAFGNLLIQLQQLNHSKVQVIQYTLKASHYEWGCLDRMKRAVVVFYPYSILTKAWQTDFIEIQGKMHLVWPILNTKKTQ